MAFRLLELESLYAISLRINIDGMGPHSPFSCSEQHFIQLANGAAFELDRIWRDSNRTSSEGAESTARTPCARQCGNVASDQYQIVEDRSGCPSFVVFSVFVFTKTDIQLAQIIACKSR